MSGIQSLKDIIDIEQIPLIQRNLPANIFEMIARSAQNNPSKSALRFFLATKDFKKNTFDYKYSDLLAKVTRLSNLLRAEGLERNDVVSIILPNLPQTYFSLLAGSTAGIASPINPTLEVNSLKGLIEGSNSKVVICLSPLPNTDIYQKTVQALNDADGDRKLITVDPGHFLGAIKRTGLKWARKNLETPKLEKHISFLGDLDDLMTNFSGDSLDFSDLPDAMDTASLFHTGGTTGHPKLAKQSHSNQIHNAWMGGKAAGSDEDRGNNVFFCGLPLFHCNAYTVTGLVPWMFEDTVVLGTPKGYRGEGIIDSFGELIEHFKINYFSGVPTIYSRLLEHLPKEHNISSLKYGLCGAAPLSEKLVSSFEEKTGITILEGYGLTECTCIATVNPSLGMRKVGSVGIRLPYSQIKIALTRDGNYLRDADAGETGRILLRGPHIFGGYLNPNHDQNAWFKSHLNEKPWLDTGDLGYLDDDGYLWLTGRSKDIIIRGGHNIDPSNVEGILEKHKDVARAIVIGRPNADLGEVPVAFVTLLPGHETSSLELTIYARQNVQEKQAVPERIQIVDELPLTQIGKVHRPTLRWQEIKEVFQDTLSKIEGINSVDVTVGSDMEHGTRADLNITTSPGIDYAQVQKRISAELTPFAIFYSMRLST